jgi:hypothetical protein
MRASFLASDRTCGARRVWRDLDLLLSGPNRPPAVAGAARARLPGRLYQGRSPISCGNSDRRHWPPSRFASRRRRAQAQGRFCPVPGRIHRRAGRDTDRLAVLAGARLQPPDLGAASSCTRTCRRFYAVTWRRWRRSAAFLARFSMTA